MSNSKSATAESAKERADHEIVEIDVDGHRYRLVTPHAKTDYIQKKLHDERVPYEYGMLKNMAGRLEPGDLVLDIGANVGNHALYLAVVAKCEVVAFEPNEVLADAMTGSVRLNRLGKRLQVEAVALGRNEDTGSFEQEVPENIGAQSIRAGDGDLRICPLDNFEFAKRVAAIKIDVEGMEMAVLEGGESLIQRDNPILYVECQSENDFKAVHTWISERGYTYWDTFNATPTHLFIHESQVQKERAVERILYKLVRDEYSAKAKVDAWRARVVKLHAELGAARERTSDLKERLSALGEDYRRVSEEIVPELRRALETQRVELARELQETRRQLDETASAYKQLANERVPQLEHELEEKRAELDETSAAYKHELSTQRNIAEHRIDELSMELEDARNALREVSDVRLPRLQQQLEFQRQFGEKRVADLKTSLTYRVGVQFREAGRSWQGLLKLPFTLLRIWREAKVGKSELDIQPGPVLMLKQEQHRDKWIGLGDVPIWQVVTVTGNVELAIFGRMALESETDAPVRCGLVRIQYLDRNRILLDGPYPRVNYSKKFGYYKYFSFCTGSECELFRLQPPPGACAVRLGFQTWNFSGAVSLVNEMRIERVGKGLSPQSRGLKKAVARSEAAERFRRECATAGWLDPDEIPASGQPKILSIMDEFTAGCFAPDCYLVQPRPDNWEPLSDLVKPDLIFIESAWKGNGGTWQYRVGSYSNKPGRELEEIAEYSRETGIPTIFWNKEDPVHHDKFLEAASLAHTIFTTDARMIPAYQKKTGNDRVFALPFAAQPTLHRPRALSDRHQRACFAGSWYGDRHSERSRDMAWLLKAVRPLGLDIFDRNYGAGNFNFPEEYREHVRGGLPYPELCRTYGRYRVFVNVNSVSESPTMFSRRVFELLACGTPVVSTYARGIEELLGTDTVWMVENEKQAADAVDALFHDDDIWRRRSLAGIRTVFSSHTYRHRLAEIYEKLGLALPGALNPRVILVAHARSQEDYDRLADFCTRQLGVDFEMKVYMDRKLSAGSRLPTSVELLTNASVNGAEIADALEQSPDTLIGWIDPQAEYEHGYLQDLINATRFAPEATVWSKAVSAEEFRTDQQGHVYGCLFRVNQALSDTVRARPAISPPSTLADNAYCIDREAFRPRQ